MFGTDRQCAVKCAFQPYQTQSPYSTPSFTFDDLSACVTRSSMQSASLRLNEHMPQCFIPKNSDLQISSLLDKKWIIAWNVYNIVYHDGAVIIYAWHLKLKLIAKNAAILKQYGGCYKPVALMNLQPSFIDAQSVTIHGEITHNVKLNIYDIE